MSGFGAPPGAPVGGFAVEVLRHETAGGKLKGACEFPLYATESPLALASMSLPMMTQLSTFHFDNPSIPRPVLSWHTFPTIAQNDVGPALLLNLIAGHPL